MKKTFVISFLLLISFLLSAETWQSNALGQKLRFKESLDGKGWEREDEGDETRLFLDGEVIFSRASFPWGYECLSDGVRTRVIYSEKGDVERRIEESEGSIREWNYFYSGSLLSSYTLSIDGQVVEIVEYYRSPDGTLLGYRRGEDDTYFLPERMVFSLDGETVVQEYEEVEKADERVWNDDGSSSSSTTIDGVESTIFYDAYGRLIRKESDESITEYTYDPSGLLDRETTISSSGESLTITYVDNRAREMEWRNEKGVTVKKRIALGDGTFEETRFVDGVPRYVFLLDRDGERILEARGL